MNYKEQLESEKHQRLVKLGRAMFELTGQNIIASVFMSIIFPFTSIRLRDVCKAAHECCEHGDLGSDKEILG